ncbi:MAG TPA: hypothetical protein VHL09_16910 [Dehalococcoidia bacterium]|nr:hypothetical protein [Dehalococcoidia bacterium]
MIRDPRDTGRSLGPDGEDRVIIRQRRTMGQPVGSARHEVHDDQARRHGREVEIPEEMNWQGDQIRWGPIVAGLATALSTLILLGLLGAAIGFTSIDAAYDAAARGAPPPDAARNAGFWAAISGMIAFLLGGFVAGKTAGVFDRKWGALNGAMVFLLALPLTLWLASMGVGALLGSAGNFAAGLSLDPSAAQNAAAAAAQNASPAEVQRAADAAKNTAWGAFGGLLLSLGLATLGGWLGTRREVEVDQPQTMRSASTTTRRGTVYH